MEKYEDQQPYYLFDSHFKSRRNPGRGMGGPIDAFKIRISCTLFKVTV